MDGIVDDKLLDIFTQNLKEIINIMCTSWNQTSLRKAFMVARKVEIKNMDIRRTTLLEQESSFPEATQFEDNS